MRTAVRWTLQHGLPRALMRRAARAGDPQARLIVDPSTRDNPFTLHDEVRARGPIVRGRLTYITATHSVVRDVLRSEDFRAGDISAVFPWPLNRVYDWAHDATVLHPIEPPSLLAVEPPEHTRYRRQVSRVFTARAVEGLRPRIQVLAEELLNELAGTGATATVDLVDRDAWLGAHLQRLRRSPGEDLLSKLVTLDDDGDRLSETELRATAGLLLAAGFETTVNLLGSGTELLLRHPEQLARLRDEPELWPNAVEEVLRVESPVQLTARSALRDTEVAGMRVPAGQRVVTLLAGANRDPEVFRDPHTVDVGRSNAKDHLSFSGGRHYCLGAALARLEGEIGLRTLFGRFPELALGPGAARRHTRVLRGWERLPVVLGLPSREPVH